MYESRDECYTAGVMKPDNAVQAIRAARFSPLPPLLHTADSFSLQPQQRSFFRKQKAGASVLNPRDKSRPASLPWYQQAEIGSGHQILQSPALRPVRQ